MSDVLNGLWDNGLFTVDESSEGQPKKKIKTSKKGSQAADQADTRTVADTPAGRKNHRITMADKQNAVVTQALHRLPQI